MICIREASSRNNSAFHHLEDQGDISLGLQVDRYRPRARSTSVQTPRVSRARVEHENETSVLAQGLTPVTHSL